MGAREQRCVRELVRQVVGCAYAVSNTLGAGFFEKVYEKAMVVELQHAGFEVQSQVRYSVTYRGHCVGDYLADLVVDGRMVVELKCVDEFSNEHLGQCLNYLEASGLECALLINFKHPRVEWKKVSPKSI